MKLNKLFKALNILFLCFFVVAINNYYEFNNMAFLDILVQERGSVESHHVIWVFDEQKANQRIFPSAYWKAIGVLDDQVVFIVQTSDFLNDFPGEISRFGLKIEKEDNPLLVFVKF